MAFLIRHGRSQWGGGSTGEDGTLGWGMSAFPPPNAVPALIAGHGRVSLLTPDGELLAPGRAEAVVMLREM